MRRSWTLSWTPEMDDRRVLSLVSGRFRSEAEKLSRNIDRSYRAVRAGFKKSREVVVFVNVQFAALPFLLRPLREKAEEEREESLRTVLGAAEQMKSATLDLFPFRSPSR